MSRPRSPWRGLVARSEALNGQQTILLRSHEDVVVVRQRVREHAVALGFSLLDQTKIVTAASELGRNTVIHGRGGEALIETLGHGGRTGLALTFTDCGPGIANLDDALRPGFTTGTGLGLGLSGSRRLVDEFDIKSEPGHGTVVRVVRWR